MAENLKRLYNFSDELLLTRAHTQKDSLNADLAAFAARFPWITGAYIASYEADIATAGQYPEDFSVMTDIKALTADVNAAVAEGKAQLDILFLYGEIAYPADRVKQRVFGQDRLAGARNNDEKMANLLLHAHSMAEKMPYKTDLLAKGYTQDNIDALRTVADKIKEKNTLQENAKTSRPVATQERILVFNNVFGRMNLLYKCAQVVFAGNAAKMEQYRVYPSSESVQTLAEVEATIVKADTAFDGMAIAVDGSLVGAGSNLGFVGLVASPVGQQHRFWKTSNRRNIKLSLE